MKPRELVWLYFKLLFEFLAATFILSLLATVGFLFSDSIWERKNAIWIGCGLFLILNARNIPMIVYLIRVLMEQHKKDFTKQTIVIQSVKSAKLHNYRFRGGAWIEEKSVLVDTDGKCYYYIGDSCASKELSWESLHITYLRKTGFLISVQLASESQSEELIRFFYKYFSAYISLKERSVLRSKVRGRIR